MSPNDFTDHMMSSNPQSLGGPLASGDFTNIATNNAADGVYTLNGVPCEIGDIIDLTNPDALFDPLVDIDAGGIKARDQGGGSYDGLVMPIKEPLLSTLLTDGFTLLLEGYYGAGIDFSNGCDIVPFDNPSAGISTYAQAYTQAIDLLPIINANENYITDPAKIPVPEQINKIAFTLTAAKMVSSLNGAAVETTISGCLGAGITEVRLNTGSDPVFRLRSFDFYEPVDDADLPSLSAI